MRLELISALPAGERRGPSILLVHGICLGAWVWERNFLPYLAERGYATYALSLRGHGGSDGADGIKDWRLRDFSQDLSWAMRTIGGPVIIVGHSMGGGVAQYYLRHGGEAAGLVLMASAPPYGLLRASLSMLNRNPSLWDELYKAGNRPLHEIDVVALERGLFSQPLAPDDHRRVFRGLTDPAIQASMELMSWWSIAPAPWLAPRTLVIGGDRDGLIPTTDLFLTAGYYGVAPAIISGCAHAIMLEPRWQTAADLVCDWLIRHFSGDGLFSGRRFV